MDIAEGVGDDVGVAVYAQQVMYFILWVRPPLSSRLDALCPEGVLHNDVCPASASPAVVISGSCI